MSKFQIAIRKFSVYFAKPVWSFIVNCVFWLFRLNMINEECRDGKYGNDVGIGHFWRGNESCNGLFNDHMDSDN